MCKSIHLLIVDDDPNCIEAISLALGNGGYNVTSASDGEEAWNLFLHPPGSFLFDLVLTDLYMPRMDGIALAQRIRRASPHVPVVALSSLEDSETIKAALRAGIRDYLDKPVEMKTLLDCVERVLAEIRAGATTREQQTAAAVRRAQQTIMGKTTGECPLHFCFEALSDAGGDVFRHYKRDDGSYLFILSDVTGHSVESSYAVASFLGTLSVYACRTPRLRSLSAASTRPSTAVPSPTTRCAQCLANGNPGPAACT
jgi:CheY-like chemotaxis protein